VKADGNGFVQHISAFCTNWLLKNKNSLKCLAPSGCQSHFPHFAHFRHSGLKMADFLSSLFQPFAQMGFCPRWHWVACGWWIAILDFWNGCVVAVWKSGVVVDLAQFSKDRALICGVLLKVQ
jgi:hypothetical protein